jgi:uncharacterized sporulation protein YeaH/YhbH (DUF444 family)
MTQVIDRRLNGKNKSAVNRERFIERFKSQIKKAVSTAMAGRSITDIEKGEKISIPARDIYEPRFHQGSAGKREIVNPGNKEFIQGDAIPRPPAGQGAGGGGSQASDTGEGTDDFVFELSRDEFLDLFFEDLALPNLTRKELAKTMLYRKVHGGYTTQGVPTNLNIVRSLRGAIARRTAIRGGIEKKIAHLQTDLKELENAPEADPTEKKEVKDRIVKLENRINKIPFIDTFDLRFNNRIQQPYPSTQAVMFCIMDVSGSMDEEKKDIAKRFFILLYLFLKRNYDTIDIVFIRHHTSAKEVTEHDFFYSRETGGTVVSSALDCVADIIYERYPSSDWNIYCAQASDGDNWNNDSPICSEILNNKIMPYVQYYAYVEILARHHQSLWESYLTVKSRYPQFSMQHIEGAEDIYPVFHELFKRTFHEQAG